MREIVLLAVSIAAVLAEPRNPQRIVGGSLTTIDQYPHATPLLFTYDQVTYSQSCGGTIINSRSILTAAHCTSGDAANRWRVRVGSHYANSGGTVYAVQQIINHPNFISFPIDNDVSILRLQNIDFVPGLVAAASIAGVNYNLADNQVVWAAGWGTTSPNGQVSEQIRHVQVWTINQDVCRLRYVERNATVTDNMLCSGWLDVGGRDQCQGDSGGPLYHNGILVGICSWGNGCADARYPGVNTRVSRYTSWIQSNA